MRRFRAALMAIAVLVAGCDPGPSAPQDHCDAAGLPLRGVAAGPTVTDVGLEVQSGSIVIVATATDPQGTDNLRGVLQSVGVFTSTTCAGEPISLEDDLSGSGIEETFGTVLRESTQPALYAQIASAQRWPVSVRFRDRDGNETGGRVMARVIR